MRLGSIEAPIGNLDICFKQIVVSLYSVRLWLKPKGEEMLYCEKANAMFIKKAEIFHNFCLNYYF